MTRNKKGAVMYYTGIVISVLAPLITAMTQFPIWTENVPKSQLGGMFIFTALLSCIPFLKHIRMQLKTPSAVTVWALILGAVLCAVGNRLRARAHTNNQYIEENNDNEQAG